MNELTAKDIAERYKVEKRVAQGWIQRGYFPNARKEETPFFVVWKVPESDLIGFNPPRAGRPKKEKLELKAA